VSRSKGSDAPVIVIGAARSGTNILRDVLTGLEGYGSWPCDEINLLWRHGNTRYPTDELPADLATEPVRRYLRRAFDRIAEREHIEHVVEKTCANSLRVAFVDRILPNARYVFIVRDGRDAVASAMKRWSAPFDLRYTLKKARYVPVTDVPRYTTRLARNRIHHATSKDGRLASWGPRFEGMDQMLRTHSLAEVCAVQWSRSVDRADTDFGTMDQSRVHRLTYETFVADPAGELERLATFLGVELGRERMSDSVRDVSPSSVGNWRMALSPGDQDAIDPYVRPTLERHGYV
jgi:hypothetical protein